MNKKNHLNIGMLGHHPKTTLGAALMASNAFQITRQEDDPPNLDGLDGLKLKECGWNAAMGKVCDDFRWGRARRGNPSQPSTSKTSKEQKRQKKARKAQRRAKRVNKRK